MTQPEMTHADWQDLYERLAAPWPESVLESRTYKGGTRGQYVPRSAIEARLNRVCPDWSSSFTVTTWGETRLIIACQLTIAGRTRSAVSEFELNLKARDGWTTTDKAAAEALKRCCRAFGMPFTGDELSAGGRSGSSRPAESQQSRPNGPAATRPAAAASRSNGPNGRNGHGPTGGAAAGDPTDMFVVPERPSPHWFEHLAKVWKQPDDAYAWAAKLARPGGAAVFENHARITKLYADVRQAYIGQLRAEPTTANSTADELEEHKRAIYRSFAERCCEVAQA